jgi:hypothetical protein
MTKPSHADPPMTEIPMLPTQRSKTVWPTPRRRRTATKRRDSASLTNYGLALSPDVAFDTFTGQIDQQDPAPAPFLDRGSPGRRRVPTHLPSVTPSFVLRCWFPWKSVRALDQIASVIPSKVICRPAAGRLHMGPLPLARFEASSPKLRCESR